MSAAMVMLAGQGEISMLATNLLELNATEKCFQKEQEEPWLYFLIHTGFAKVIA